MFKILASLPVPDSTTALAGWGALTVLLVVLLAFNVWLDA